jgi:isochorismate hydrolase
LACVKGDIPLAFTVQPISRNDEQFYKELLEDAWKTGVKFRVVAGGRQFDSAELR